MSKRTANSILTEALSAYQDIDDPRIKEILQAAIKHVHAFASELKLTHEEWLEGVEYLTCLLYTSPSPRDQRGSRMPSSA